MEIGENWGVDRGNRTGKRVQLFCIDRGDLLPKRGKREHSLGRRSGSGTNDVEKN